MECKPVARVVLASVAIGALLGSPQLMAECFPVKGKILNTLHSPPLGSIKICDKPMKECFFVGGVSTLGVVSFNGGTKFGQMKCAIVGVVDEPTILPDAWPDLSSFYHTLSCDDTVPDSAWYDLPGHSQLTFHTTGEGVGDAFTFPTFDFIEHSSPVPGSGFGAFAGATNEGVVTITGTTNLITGSIDMEFTGEICTTE
jgi:hypothetical protein